MNTVAANEIVPSNWSAEDREWLVSAVAPDFQGLAIEYGRTLFAMSLKAWMLSGALGKIVGLSSSLKEHKEIVECAETVGQSINEVYAVLFEIKGITFERFRECQQAIQNRALLLQGTHGKTEFTPPPSIQLQ